MIITKLQGGLGNQIFQYTFGKSLAKKNNTDLKLDLSFYNDKQNNLQRNYSLKYFNTKENIALDKETKKLKKNEWKDGRRSFFHNLFFANKSIYIKEKQFNFDKKILKTTEDIYLDGYWQSEKYFKDIEKIIKKELTLKERLSNRAKEIAKEIKNSNSISIHVRRGDYVKNPRTNSHHGLCSISYYEKSIKKITQQTQNTHFFIFSDDIKWAKKNLKTSSPTTFVEDSKDHEDLILMSLCKHNIIANSSFSWWGAWLNNNPNKIIIAPQKWFNDPKRNTVDLIPKSWIRI